MNLYCKNCGAEVSGGNFCSYCGQALTDTTSSISLMNKAVSTANLDDQYNLVLVSCGSCSKTMTGDLLEDVFGYSDSESSNLVNMAPVVVGERLTESKAKTVAQFLTEYGIQVSVTNENDQYVDLTSNATSSIFDNSGNLIASAVAIIGALTVSNRIKSYRKYEKPSLFDTLFHINYNPNPPQYRRRFRPHLEPSHASPRQTIRKSPSNHTSSGMFSDKPGSHGNSGHGSHGGGHSAGNHRR